MKEIRTEIEIDANAERVWDIFSNFNSYPKWSTFVKNIEGKMEAGKKIELDLETPKGMKMHMKPEVLKADEEREFRWLGHLAGVNFLFNGEHFFKLEPRSEGRTRFIQGERFTGILVPFLWRSLNTDTRAGFENFNKAIKKRAEGSAA